MAIVILYYFVVVAIGKQYHLVHHRRDIIRIDVVGKEVLYSVMVEIDISFCNGVADGRHEEAIDSVADAKHIVVLCADDCPVGHLQDALSRYVGVVGSRKRNVIQASRYVALQQHHVAHGTFLEGCHCHQLCVFIGMDHLEGIDSNEADAVEVDRTRDEVRHIGLPFWEPDSLAQLASDSDGVAQAVVALGAIDIYSEFYLPVETQFLGLGWCFGFQRVELHHVLGHVLEDSVGLVAEIVDEHKPDIRLVAGIDGHRIEICRLGLERVAFLYLEANAHVSVLVELCRHFDERSAGLIGAGRHLQVASVLNVREVVEQTARLAALQLGSDSALGLVDSGAYHQFVVTARIVGFQADQLNILAYLDDHRVEVSAVVLHGGKMLVPHL